MTQGTKTQASVYQILVTSCLAAAIAISTPAQDKTAIAMKPLLRNLQRAAAQIATKGHHAEFATLVEVLKQLGEPEKSITSLQKRGAKSLKKAKRRKPAPGEARTLRRTARKLGELLAKLPEERRRDTATAIIRIDRTVELAHNALGHVKRRGRWVPKGIVAALDRRDTMQIVAQTCRKMKFDLEVGDSNLPAVRAVTDKGSYVAWKNVSLHSPTLAPARLERILLSALRAWTYSHYLETGKLTPPKSPKLKAVLLRSRAEYLKTVDEALANGGIDPKFGEMAKKHWAIFADDRGDAKNWQYTTGFNILESGHAAFIFRELFSCQNAWGVGGNWPEPVAPNLHKGHLNFIGQTFLGSRIPDWGYVESRKNIPRVGTSASPEETAERKLLIRLSASGISGVRAYLRYLARRNEDPKISATIVSHTGALAGELLLKSISLVEFMHETGRFFPMLRRTRAKPTDAATFVKLLGQDLGSLERQWREWILGDDLRSSIVDRLESGANPGQATPKALTHLNSLRKGALPSVEGASAIGLDAALSDSCRAHAQYLLKNVAQQSAWPDCHEQYSDRPGFSPEGCWAGGNSVIDPGAKSGVDAVNRWMATFYHRLPLLHPGLLRIGWAREGNVAVLDSGSMVDYGWEEPLAVPYPPAGAQKVPLAFSPEMPNPVPGADQAAFGYPITLQLYSGGDEPSIIDRLRLYRGSAKPGNEVSCYFSTPDKPSNPVLAPGGAYCLIPKVHLRANTTYVVTVECAPATSALLGGTEWKFKTGSR